MTKPMNMRKAIVMVALLPFLYLADVSHDAPAGLTFVRDAHAIVGAPASPGSVAGVARRTTRRTVAATSTATAATAQPVSESAPATSPAARPAGAPAAGTVVTALPAGCVPETIGGVEYQRCGGVSYRSAYQGSNLVYVAQ